MNKIGHTALDVLEAYNVYPRDVKWFEIQNILKEAGVRRSTNRNSSLSPTLSGNGVDEAKPSQSRFRGWWECIRSSLVKHLRHEENWIQETRGTLMEANMAALYEASRNGCISTLTTLIQSDARILDRVSLTSFSETPLHLSISHGHLEFSKILVSKKPKLAKAVDSLGQTPLHLASAEGHTEIVQALLQTNINACLARDQDGRIPLHLAAMRGRIGIIEKLIKARQESILMNLEGDSVLHLCIRYNHLNAQKLLVELANGNESFLSSKDLDGNSILHLAVMLKQKQVR
ncbi:ankyrin repeat-containing protein BDA1-like [Corylus avellana]|uniref:ankyrin repeat-containing protein BDA1-like n=1 Tax=Corylus avellana TaxID=13451 RepID=UPI00286B5771|nr:ankyrin repeat-containing protein BDA1-like [Corylus avellana]